MAVHSHSRPWNHGAMRSDPDETPAVHSVVVYECMIARFQNGSKGLPVNSHGAHRAQQKRRLLCAQQDIEPNRRRACVPSAPEWSPGIR